MTSDFCRSELVLAGRRRRLSASDQLALQLHLRECESCRLTHLFGGAFDATSQIHADDDRRLDEMLAASDRWFVQPRTLVRGNSRNQRLKVIGFAAVILATATAAAAAIAIRASESNLPPLAVTGSSGATQAQRHAAGQKPMPLGAGMSVTTVTPQAQPPEASTAAATKLTAPHVNRASPDANNVELAAEQLLKLATQARRDGSFAEASRLYRRLQRLYPASRETGLSRVTYGSLLLEQRQASPALYQFNRYLSTDSTQNLAAEALYGKARALAMLGRSAEEMVTWQLLLDKFPKSPYISNAKKRLASTP